MKGTGIVRRFDDLGRIVIPRSVRKSLGIRDEQAMEIFTDEKGRIILQQYSPDSEDN